jgi:ABC-type sugar transport system ATPase subunit
MAENNLLEMRNISKSFPGVMALSDVQFSLCAGEVHALLGENGAGKSTLVKVLSGIYRMDSGEIWLRGEQKNIDDVNDARANGISVIHQELVLAPYLSVAENIFLGREPVRKYRGLDFAKMHSDTAVMLQEFGLDIDPEAVVADLNIAQQQMIEIVKAISFSSSIVVMDEPTSSLSDAEVEALFNSIRQLKAKGIGVIYISHRMSELNQIADRVTVLRDGKYVGTRVMAETNMDELISMMVGRPVENFFARTFIDCPDVVLRVDHLCSSVVRDVSFDLRRGEILGFAGLIGAGRSEAMKALFGIDKPTGGHIEIDGRKLPAGNTARMIGAGVGFVPENRKEEAIFPLQGARFNITLKVLREFIHGLFVNEEKEQEIASYYIDAFSIKTPNLETSLQDLSGGNQQKVVISSWLAKDPKILILDEPTRGIDVGAKGEIYTIMNKLTQKGVSIIMISSDLPEVINMSDRVAVMCEGTITKILDRDEITQEKIMRYAMKV